MTVMVTGAAGMIGTHLVRGLLNAGYDVVGVDRCALSVAGAQQYVVDLCDYEAVRQIITENKIDRVIHLAALAHTAGETDLSYDAYYKTNVTCAQNIFRAAENIPVLFISTVDVYGFVKEIATAETTPRPVTDYGKTKALAEESCKKICKQYSIYRFQPVYTESVKRDIQKRYYLKYPNLAYLIGKGTEYEVLDIRVAVEAMVNWCKREPCNEILNVKNKKRLYTPDCIAEEKSCGRAKYVLHIPKWIANMIFVFAKTLTGENKYTYLLNKAVHPLRTE